VMGDVQQLHRALLTKEQVRQRCTALHTPCDDTHS
jgi:hypothetical protein